MLVKPKHRGEISHRRGLFRWIEARFVVFGGLIQGFQRFKNILRIWRSFLEKNEEETSARMKYP
jgi:hypothetical protein